MKTFSIGSKQRQIRAALTRPALMSIAHAYSALDRSMWRIQQATHDATSGFLGASLSDEEKSRMSIAVNKRRARPDRDVDSLFPWEKVWFESQLPVTPARILLGGAGTGREVSALIELGYSVDALEPAKRPFKECQKRISEPQIAVMASYQDLSAAVLGGVEGQAAVFRGRTYDAIVLGWGSFSHVLNAQERVRLMETCERLCPTGPILLSFLTRAEHARNGHSSNIGLRAGKLVGKVRGLKAWEPGDELFRGWAGFWHLFSDEDIEKLAAQTNRRVIWGHGSTYRHATFVKRIGV